MTIKEIANKNGFKNIDQHKIKNIVFYELWNDGGGCVGLPFYVIETKNGLRKATPDETLKILDLLDGRT